MHIPVTVSQARALYPKADLAVSFTVEHSNASVVVFQIDGTLYQVNSFPNGNQQAFGQRRSELVDDYFQNLALEEDNFRVLIGQIEGIYNHK